MIEFWIDGGGWNGKTSKWCVVEKVDDKIFLFQGETDQERTGNYMEYQALLRALLKTDDEDTIYTDSKLIEGQMTKGWKINYPHLRKLKEKADSLIGKKDIKIVWIPREENKAGQILDDGKIN